MKQTTASACAKRVPIFTLALLATGCVPLAAQSTALVLSPTTLSFTTAAGSSPPGQSIAVASGGAAANFTASAISTGNWLSVTPATGATPGTLSVSVNSQTLTSGTYGGFIQLASADGAASTVPVTLAVTSSGLMNLTAAPASLTYDFASGATASISRDIVLTSAGMQAGSVASSVTTSSPMLSVSLNPSAPAISPTTPATVAVSVSPTGLTPGRYYAAIAFGAPGTGGTVVFATVNVGMTGAAALTSSPAQLALTGQVGGTTPVAQTLQITAPGSAPVQFSVTSATTSCGSAWLSVTPTSATTPATLTVQANPSALPAGACQGAVSLTAMGATTPVTIPVTFTLSAGSALTVPATGPSFSFQIGGSVPAAQSVSIASTASPLSISAAVSGTPAFLTVTPTSATTPASLQLSLTAGALTGLAAGTYTNTVTVTSDGASNSPRSFPVTLTVSAAGGGGAAVLSATPAAADFVFQVGQSPPAAQTIQVSSSGVPTRYNVTSTTTSCPGFFTVSPMSGSTSEFDAQGQLRAGQITITPLTSGLSTATACAGTVSIAVDGGSGTPITVPVTLNVVTANTLTAAPLAIQATALAGSPTPNTQTIAVASTTSAVPLSFTASVVTDPPAQTWLSVTPTSSQTPANLTVNLNQSGLLPGVYQGSIRLSTGGTTPVQTIPVRFTVVGNLLTPTPGTLSFTQPVGGAAPSAQTINLGILPAGAVATAVATPLNGSGWLTANAPAGQNVVTVNVNSAGLAEGIYRGVVTITVPGSSPSPLNVPVTFTYGTPSALTATPTTLSFAYTAGSTTTPSAQTVQVTTSGAAIPFSVATTSASGGNFFTVTPASGTTPGTLTVSLNQAVIANLAAGSYAGTITLSSTGTTGSQTIAVNLTVAAGPTPGTPTVTSMVNLASNQAGAAPGTIITLLGTNLGPTAPVSLQLTSAGAVQTTLAETTVTVDGVAAPLLLVSGTQINAIVPYEAAGKTSVPVVVRRTLSGSTVSSTTTALAIAPTAPGILTLGMMGTGQGAILNQNGTINGTSSPAAPGSIIVVYATGEGVLSPAVATGSVTSATGSSFPQPVAAVSATVGGSPATVLYAGSAPGLIAGLLQVNLRLPESVASGAQPVVLTVGGVSSRTGVTAAIQ
jgi:uncharacterized protein (TIGR03437 family)